MAADAWILHDKFKLYKGNATANMESDVFKLALFLSTSNIATTSINALSTATNQHANANGYTTGGLVIASPTWIESAGTVTFDTSNAVWTATGGEIRARFGGIYDDTITSPVADPIVCHSLLDNAPADKVATDTKTFTITMNALGVFTET